MPTRNAASTGTASRQCSLQDVRARMNARVPAPELGLWDTWFLGGPSWHSFRSTFGLGNLLNVRKLSATSEGVMVSADEPAADAACRCAMMRSRAVAKHLFAPTPLI